MLKATDACATKALEITATQALLLLLQAKVQGDYITITISYI
jgi:hypothetical protein